MSSFITRYPAKDPPPQAAPPPPTQPAGPTAVIQYATNPGSSTRTKVQIVPEAASRALQHLIAAGFQQAGFDASDRDAMELMERLVEDFVLDVARLAHGYSELSNRATPHVRDVVMACDERGMSMAQLKSALKTSKRQANKKRKPGSVWKAPRIKAPPPQPKPPELLPSDSEEDEPMKDASGDPIDGSGSKDAKQKRARQHYPTSLLLLPSHFPRLPPKHTYLRTDPPAPTTTSLSSLQQKINNAAIIQSSLRNLIQATETAPPLTSSRSQHQQDDMMTDADDDTTLVPSTPIGPGAPVELPVPPGLSGFVNWEGASGVRKTLPRWKV